MDDMELNGSIYINHTLSILCMWFDWEALVKKWVSICFYPILELQHVLFFLVQRIKEHAPNSSLFPLLSYWGVIGPILQDELKVVSQILGFSLKIWSKLGLKLYPYIGFKIWSKDFTLMQSPFHLGWVNMTHPITIYKIRYS
jgi:hypothetical protein